MPRFFVCTGCRRHVKQSDASCPFCGTQAAPVLHVGPSRVASRIAAIAAVAAGTGACAGGAEPAYGVPAEDSGVTEDAGTVVDAGEEDAGDPGNGNNDYGAPGE